MCYHLACDTIENINWRAITISTKAAANALAAVINSLDEVPPRSVGNGNRRRGSGFGGIGERELLQESLMAVGDGRGTGTCSSHAAPAGGHKHRHKRVFV